MLGLYGEPDCGDSADYLDSLLVPVNVDSYTHQQTFCLIGRDNALNQTPVRELCFEVKRWYEVYRKRPTRMLRDTEGLMPARQWKQKLT